MAVIPRELLQQGNHQLHFKLLLNGPFGSGKTYKAMTFPKWAYAMWEPNGIMTARTSPELLSNMVYYESFLPSNDEDIKQTFLRYDAFLKQARKDAQEGKIETVIVDNLTHQLEARWLYIEKYEKSFGKGGEVDTRGMYGTLGRWAFRSTVLDLLSIPCHIVLTCHITDEKKSDPKTGQQYETGKIISDTLGNFRKEVSGLFNAALFLDLKREPVNGKTVYHYLARCLPSAGIEAKNNLGLPEIVENISYQTLVACLPKLNGAQVNGEGKA